VLHKRANHLDNSKCSNIAKAAAARRAKSNLNANTVMTQFKTQLTGFMKGLAESKSRYVHCVKPNTKKRKLVMECTMPLVGLEDSVVVDSK
jgi:myosin heavy subunit